MFLKESGGTQRRNAHLDNTRQCENGVVLLKQTACLKLYVI